MYFGVNETDYSQFENRLEVHIEPRPFKPVDFHIFQETVESTHDDQFFSKYNYYETSINEFTRDFVTYSIASNSSSTIEATERKAVNAATLRFPDVDDCSDVVEDKSQFDENELLPSNRTRILHSYYPEVTSSSSSFKRLPSQNRHLIDNVSAGYMKLLLKIGPAGKLTFGKQNFFEPLFGSVCLYCLQKNSSSTEYSLQRISESFYFDATPESIRSRFKNTVYDSDISEDGTKSTGFNPATNLSMCMFNIPPNCKLDDLFLIVQIQKVLTADPDKALAPYHSSNMKLLSSPDITKTLEACKRLHKYRQPVGFQMLKLFNQDGSAFVTDQPTTSLPLYAMKTAMSDDQFKQVIVDTYRPENNNRPPKLESLELELNLTPIYLGKDDEMMSKLPAGMKKPSGEPLLYMIPSQFHTAAEENNTEWFKKFGQGGTDMLVARNLLALPMPYSQQPDEVFRYMRSNFDNTLFVYPIHLENFAKRHERNLCVEVQFVEVTGDVCDMPTVLQSKQYTVLPNIYNRMLGPVFCTSAYTLLSYHKSSPEINDEIKIKLPLKITKNHFVLFHIYHIHVKNRNSEGRSSFFLGKKEESSEGNEVHIGTGWLPVLLYDLSLLQNQEYSLSILENRQDDDESGVTSRPLSTSSISATPNAEKRRSSTSPLPAQIRIATKVLSSIMSTSVEVQHFLNCHPPHLGRLPTAQKSAWVAKKPSHDDEFKIEVSESELTDATKFFLSLNSVYLSREHEIFATDDVAKHEIGRHFYGIMRQFIRILTGGPNSYSPAYANPHAHPDLRCLAMFAMLRIFDIVDPELDAASDGTTYQHEFLRSYVDYILDEEVFVDEIPNQGSHVVDIRNEYMEHVNEDILEESAAEHLCQQVEDLVIRGFIVSKLKSIEIEDFDRPLKVNPLNRWWSAKSLDRETINDLERKYKFQHPKSYFTRVCTLSEPILVEPIRSRLHRIEGYSIRRVQIKEIIRENGEQTGNPPIQWWPYLYEVLTKQWSSFLMLYEDSDNRNSPRVGSGKNTLAKTESILEGDEEEWDGDTDPEGCDDSSIPLTYPFSKNDPIFDKRDMRAIFMNYGPILLEMIYKSLVLRIFREEKQSPVIIDEEYLNELEKLVVHLAKEVNNNKKSIIPARNLNTALAHFLRSLFAIIAPIQVGQLITAYFTTSRKCQTTNHEKYGKIQIDQILDRLKFIREIYSCDYYVEFNFPLSIDSPFDDFVLKPIKSVKDLLYQASGSEVRAVKNPPSHWLAHVVIDEIMSDYNVVDIAFNKYRVVSALKELLVRHSYDKRYQSVDMRMRICAMYLPLLKYIINDGEHLAALPYDDSSRREVLALFLYILQDCPEHLLREEWRRLCKFTIEHKNSFQKEQLAFTATLPIYNLLTLYHLVLDTFELTINKDRKGFELSTLSPDIVEALDTPKDSGLQSSNDASSSGNSRIKANSINRSGIQGKTNKLELLENNIMTASKKSRPGKGSDEKGKSLVSNSKMVTKAISVDDLLAQSSVRSLCHESTMLLLHSYDIIMEECPSQLQNIESRYIDISIEPKCFDFLENSFSILLHVLYSNQSEIAISRSFQSAISNLKRFGFVIFNRIVRDTLQDWLRVVLIHCNSNLYSIRKGAAMFLLTILQSCFKFEGSITSICRVMFGVLLDVLMNLREKSGSSAKSVYLNTLQLSIIGLKDLPLEVESSYDFYCRLHQLTEQMQWYIHSYIFIEHSLLVPISYAWTGVNALDSLGYQDSSSRDSIAVSPVSEPVNDEETSIDNVCNVVSFLGDYDLIRLQLYFLENLGRYHDLNDNKIESAFVRWRLFEISFSVKNKWEAFWTPRPPFRWSKVKGVENMPGKAIKFMDAYNIGRRVSTYKVWSSKEQYESYLTSCLRVSYDKFLASKLQLLAERSLITLIHLYKETSKKDEVSKCYEMLGQVYSGITSSEIAFSLGTFFRVYYVGNGVPDTLRGKEYVLRNADHLHVSEFQSSIKNQLSRLITNPAVTVTCLPDTAPVPPMDDPGAYIIITAVNPLQTTQISSSNVLGLTELRLNRFQFAVPFTQEGKAHAKTIDKQWKRTTVLTTRHNLPNLCKRQEVVKRDSRDSTPIEVAIEDITERVDAIIDELSKRRDSSDVNNLMRLIQGTVIPQVNAGAGEVARVFLSPDANQLDLVYSETLINKLKIALVEFLRNSRKLMNLAREVLCSKQVGSSDLTAPQTQLPLSRGGSDNESHNDKWLVEMERGYDNLMKTIYPFVSDLVNESELRLSVSQLKLILT